MQITIGNNLDISGLHVEHDPTALTDDCCKDLRSELTLPTWISPL